MSILKYIDRLKKMDDLILHETTGTAEMFARTLDISVSVLKENLSKMRALGADIEFCRTRKSYFYKNKCRLIMGFDNPLIREQYQKIKGGYCENLFARLSDFKYPLPLIHDLIKNAQDNSTHN